MIENRNIVAVTEIKNLDSHPPYEIVLSNKSSIFLPASGYGTAASLTGGDILEIEPYPLSEEDTRVSVLRADKTGFTFGISNRLIKTAEPTNSNNKQ